MISPDMVAFAVRALIRVGSSAAEAYEQSVRDAEIRVEGLPAAERFDADDDLWRFFWDAANPELMKRSESGDLANCWVDQSRVRDAAARLRLVEEYTKLVAAKSNQASRHNDAPVLLRQWANGAGPPAPMVRVALAFADVALDFVSVRPGILGVGGDGEKLITALSKGFKEILPDVDNPAAWKGKNATLTFAEGAATVVFRAGLKTIADNPDAIIDDEQYKELLKNVLSPLVTAFDKNQLPRFSDVRDLLLGPMAKVALETLQQNQEAFLGASFATNTALGAVAEAVFKQAATAPSGSLVTPQGLLGLYGAVLKVAVAQPKLFLTQSGAKSDAASKVIGVAAEALQTAPAPFTGDAGLGVAIATIDAFRDNLRPFLGAGAWEDAAADLLTQIMTGFSNGLRSNDARQTFETVFSKDQATELVATLLRHVAQTPSMLGVADGRKEVQALISVIASAAVSKDGRLLGAADWTAVAESAITEVIRNPLRLVDPAVKVEAQFLAALLATILGAAAKNVPDNQRNIRTILFGETLRQCVTLTIRAAAGNSAQAALHLNDLTVLIELINQAVEQNPKSIGAQEWLFLFERHVTGVLDAGTPAGLTLLVLLAELRSPS